MYWIDAALRRTMDVLGALLALVLLSPCFAILAYLIRRDSPGPVFYHGRRAGLHGKPFRIHKFRTMYERPQSYTGAAVTAEDDDRITPFGRFLRNSKLNELPQLWNVLVGQMSLVGPRPEDANIAAGWPPALRAELLSVRPGITSPASIIYRGEEKLLNAGDVMEEYLNSILPSKMRLDLLYVRNRTFLTDLDVIFSTAIALLPVLGQRAIPEERLYFGPLERMVRRNLSWLTLDILVTFVSVTLAAVFWRLNEPVNLGLGLGLLAAVAISLLFGLINNRLGLTRVVWPSASSADAALLFLSSALATALTVVLRHLLVVSPKELPDGVLLLTGMFSLCGFVTLRYRGRLVTGLATRWLNLRGAAGGVGERVLVLGGGDSGEVATWLFNRGHLAQVFRVVGILDDNPRKQGMRINNVEVIGTTRSLAETVKKLDVGLIVFAIFSISSSERERLLDECYKTGARLALLPNLMEQMANGTPSANSLASEQVRAWLEEVQQVAQTGCMEEVQSKLAALLEKLPEDHLS
jgi:lipopolysaccharide/colanic/teichoic acid biosynthesis glycosyltransferase